MDSAISKPRWPIDPAQSLDSPEECEVCTKLHYFFQHERDREAYLDYHDVPLALWSELASAECSCHGPLFLRLFQFWREAFQGEEVPIQINIVVTTIEVDARSLFFRARRQAHEAAQVEDDFEFKARWFGPVDMMQIEEDTSMCGSGIRLDHNWIGFGCMQSWYDECKATHGEHCASPVYYHHLPAPVDQILVDTVDMCLVPAKPRTPYIALSYVWGQTTTLQTTTENFQRLQRPGALEQPKESSTLPRTVQHAIHLARLFKERFLWVDGLCIVQDDKQSMHGHLNQMAAIFAHAEFVIIAADGNDANYGLRGLREIENGIPRQLDQDIIPFGDRELYFRKDLNHRRMKKGIPYYDRGWTFQEHDFARRRIYFEGASVRFECQLTERFEDTNKSVRVFAQDVDWVHTTGYPSTTVYLQMVNDFNRRHLTYPEDALGAFAGIISNFNMSFPGGFLCGLPEMFFHVALLWQPGGNLTRRVNSRPNSVSSTTAGCLPSWSWVGWRGDIDTRSWASANDFIASCSGRISLSPSQTTETTKWFTADDRGGRNRRPIHAEWAVWRKRYKDATAIPPDGWSKVKRKPEETFSNPNMPAGHGDYVWKAIDELPKFWYPIPLSKSPNEGSLAADSAYIFATVQTASLFAAGKQVETKHTLRTKWLQMFLQTTDGQWAGIIRLHNLTDLENLSSCPGGSQKRLQLAAISQSFIPGDAKRVYGFEEYNASGGPTKGELYEYYNVMWIEQEDGIAYRKAVGRVEKSRWESLGLESIDLVLG